MKKTLTLLALFAVCTCCFAGHHHSGLRGWERALLITDTVLNVANAISTPTCTCYPACTYPTYSQPVCVPAPAYAPAPVYVNPRPVIVTPPRPSSHYCAPAPRHYHYDKPIRHYNDHFGKPADRRQPRRK